MDADGYDYTRAIETQSRPASSPFETIPLAIGKGVIQSTIENPINGVSQLIGFPKLELVDAESAGYAAKTGEALGNVAVFFGVNYLVGQNFPGLSDTARMGFTGAITDGLLKPSAYDQSLVFGRVKNATVGVASMAAYGLTKNALEQNTDMFATAAARSLAENIVLNGVGGAASGLVSIQADAILSNGRPAGIKDTAIATANGALFGAGFGVLEHAVRTYNLTKARRKDPRPTEVMVSEPIEEQLRRFGEDTAVHRLNITRDEAGQLVKVQRLTGDKSYWKSRSEVGPVQQYMWDQLEPADTFYKSSAGNWMWQKRFSSYETRLSLITRTYVGDLTGVPMDKVGAEYRPISPGQISQAADGTLTLPGATYANPPTHIIDLKGVLTIKH